jgi:hypothetical protein
MKSSTATAPASASASDANGSLTADSGQQDDQRFERSGRAATRVLLAAWAAIAALILRHREVISTDTLSNYVHVWYVSNQLWHGHGLPFHMPVLGAGQALAFPYGFLPWMLAVLMWPLLGEWGVTLVLVLGFVFMAAATFWAFPELRKGWWAVAVLVNPAFAEGLLLGQLPFTWAAGMLLIAIGAWRREWTKTAVVFAALAQFTHAPIVLPLTAGLVAVRYRFEPDRAKLIKCWLISLIPALPAALLVFVSPVTGTSSIIYTLYVEIETLLLRSLALVVPFALLYLQRRGVKRSTPILFAGVLVFGQLVTIPISGMRTGWAALYTSPDQSATAVSQSDSFVPGATYRVLSFGDGKYWQYSIVRAGGRLDSEFFPESLYRRSFSSDVDYAEFLTKRHVDYVVVQDRYHKFKTNELALLTSMSDAGGCIGGVTVRPVESNGDYQVFGVTRGCAQPA